MENDLTCKLGKEENLYRVLYTYAAEIYDKNEDTLKLQVLQEVLHSDMNNNVSQDVIRRLERKGWEIHVKAKAKQDVFKIKGGYLTGKKVSVQEVEALAKLPSRDQLLSMLLNSMLGPIRKLAYATVAIADKKEGSAE